MSTWRSSGFDTGPAGILGVQKQGVQTVQVQEDVVSTCWQLYLRHPVMRACRGVIYGILFSGTLELVTPDEEEPQPEFVDFMRRYWIPFARDAADSLRVTGYVPYMFKLCADGSGNYIPVVPPRDTYSTEMLVSSDFTRRMVLRSRLGASRSVIDSVRYFVQAYPSMQGEIDSSLIALAPALVRLEALTNAAIECEINAARPTMVTQVRKENDTMRGNAASMAVATGISQWVATSAREITNADTLDADNSNLERLHYAREEAIAYNRKAMATAVDPASSHLGMGGSRAQPGHELKAGVLNIPKGLEYVPTRVSAPHQDLAAMNNLVEDLICAEMGVPNSLIHPAHASFDSGTLVQRVVNMELVRLAKLLEDVMSTAYELLYTDTSDSTDSTDSTGSSDPTASSYNNHSSNSQRTNKQRVHAFKNSKNRSKQTRVVLRYPTFCDPEILLNACAQVDLYDQAYVGELFARAAGFWCDGVTDKFVVSTEQLEQKKRKTKEFESKLELEADHQRAKWAAAAQSDGSGSGSSSRQPGRPSSGKSERRGADGGDKLSTDVRPPSLVPTRRANTARAQPVASAGQRVAAAKERLNKRQRGK